MLTLQASAGNRAVASTLPGRGLAGRPVVSRVIAATAAVGDGVELAATRERFRILQILGGNAASLTSSRVRMFLLKPVAGGQERLVHGDDPRFASTAAPPAAPAAPAAAPAAAAARPFDADPDGDFTFEGWFVYFWDEVSAATQAQMSAWAAQYKAGQHQSDNARRAVLEQMFAEGFIEYDVPPRDLSLLDASLLERAAALLGMSPKQAGVTTSAQLAPGPALAGPAAARRYRVALPILAGTTLGYRADSRDWQTIQQQSGSKAQARVEAAPIKAGRNFDKAWNPFQSPARQQRMYLRKAHQDNCTRTVVSVAMDLRDTLTFPKPKVTMTGSDTVTIYVVHVPRVMDTSALALDLWNAPRWERGETAAFEIPAQHHLMRLTVERYFDPSNASYVVGRIASSQRLNADRWHELPLPARNGLNQLQAAIGGGQIRWFEWGTANPAAGGSRTAIVGDVFEAATAAPGGMGPTPEQRWDAAFQRLVVEWGQTQQWLTQILASITARAVALMGDVATITRPAPVPAPVAVGVGVGGPPPLAAGPGGGMGAARGRIKTQLTQLTTRVRTLVQETAVAGMSKRMYPHYVELLRLNQQPQAQIDAAGVEAAIVSLHTDLRPALRFVHDELARFQPLGAGLQVRNAPAADWERLVTQILRTALP